METTSITTDSRPRWFYPTPARLLMVLLVVEGIVLLSKPWFPQGCAVLTAIASVGITMLAMLIWWLAALCFHRRFQFSLRSLLVLTVAVAIPFSWLAVELKKAREQREAVEAIRRSHSTVTPCFYLHFPPEWLIRLLPIECLVDSYDVTIGTQATDEDLIRLERLELLEMLTVKSERSTDAGLVHLRGLNQLWFLSLENTQFTDAGLAHLRELHSLRCLELKNTKVTARGIKKLKEALPDCNITE